MLFKKRNGNKNKIKPKGRKRKFLKRIITVGLGVWTLKYGRINQTIDLPINPSQEIQSINNKITYRETESSFTELVSDQYLYQDSNESLTGKKLELTYTQYEGNPIVLVSTKSKHNIEDRNEVILAAFKNPPGSNHASSLPAKKTYGEAEGVYVLPDSGPVNPDGDATVPVESIMGTVPGLKAQYDKLLTNEESARNATNAIKKLATGRMSDIKKIKGMKSVFEARRGDVRVYFQKEGYLVKIIAPCLKKDQDKSLRLFKGSFK